ncbi:MADS-box transcription factor 14 [Lactuca sativa]|uniref:MADS-box transcription factor 14 n=1 Tax=Lactuca sativa TaxID=4236 RepID=UPI000CD82733|nr:MADS-box transcription factor 14 [Lactuca sativa]
MIGWTHMLSKWVLYSVELILSRYQKSILETEEEEEERSTQEKASQDYMEGTNYPCTRFRTCKELLESVRRVDEEGNKVSVSDMTELEEELSAALMHTRSRKTQLMMERISSLHEQEKKLTEEKEEMKQQLQLQVASAAKQKGYLDDGASSHCYKTNSSQLLITLPLFNFKDLD